MQRFTIALLLAAFAVAAPLAAQDGDRSFFSKMSYEYFAGAGIGYYDQVFSGAANTEAEGRVGFSWKAGVSAVYPFSSSFGLDLNLAFINKGAGARTWLTGLGDPIQEDFSYNIQYISLPIHIRYYIVPDVLVYAGPEFGYGIRFAQDGKTINKKYTKPFGISFEYGVALYLDKDWYMGLAFSQGLTKAFERSGQSKTPHSIMLTTGFGF
ncbi:MAG: outer membrane beta-barrel protein [Candidatus Cryptobacteroides sp.]